MFTLVVMKNDMKISAKKTYFVRVIHVDSGETVILRTCISAKIARKYRSSYGLSVVYKLIMFPMDEYNHKASHVDGWEKTKFGWIPGEKINMENIGYNWIG